MFSQENTIEIELLVVGFVEYFKKINEALLQFPNLKVTYLSISSYDEMISNMENYPLEYEIILFTDPTLIQMFRSHIPNSFEYNLHHLHTNELSLLIYYNELLLKSPITNISIDFYNSNIKNRFGQLLSAEKLSNILLHNHCLEEVISFHEKNYLEKNSAILTSSPLVFRELEKLGIPVVLAISHYSEIMLVLERAILSSPTRQSREKQPVVFIFEFPKISDHGLPLIKTALNQYKKLLSGILYQVNASTYHLLTNFGIFENVSHGYKKIHLLDSLYPEDDITVKIGIGLGNSHAISLYNANLALSQSKNREGDTCFIAREDKSIFGPIEPNQEPVYEKYNLSIKNSEFIQMAKEFQMSAIYLSKLVGRLQADKKLTYTSDELAITLNVTIRSANRILLNWLDANLISIIGEEKVNANGRPRRLYYFDFLKEKLFI